MHSHLDKPENLPCIDVINALEECHARGFLWKSIGMCNDAKTNLNACLWVQRQKRAANNREAARARRDKIKQKEQELGL
ncbi:unnamed protein product [Parascedosporium putredinis]|uniref:COX assembly mitochondrial protein n=1 Tax=Parascedosporium putredinis TaxID=1442378 RepID=A0A9P1H485_9PEZI|nr:unnamed protein product [Parascedosporium putredinis]CAI7998018.1 unnamed protein product [Parascedosporium putredinis]